MKCSWKGLSGRGGDAGGGVCGAARGDAGVWGADDDDDDDDDDGTGPGVDTMGDASVRGAMPGIAMSNGACSPVQVKSVHGHIPTCPSNKLSASKCFFCFFVMLPVTTLPRNTVFRRSP